jgi:hypothetical protein
MSGAHRRFTMKITPRRNCGICHEPIAEIPRDVDPDRARFCMACRENMARQEADCEPWIDRGNRGGARLGFDYIVR